MSDKSYNIKERVRVGNKILTHLTHRHDGNKDNALLARVIEKRKQYLRVALADGSEVKVPYNAIVDTMDKENLSNSLGQLGRKFKVSKA